MATQAATTQAGAPSTVVVDLGKQKRKQVRQLRKGEGRLMDEIDELVDGMRAEGSIDKNAQTVVVVVRQKRRNNAFLRGFRLI